MSIAQGDTPQNTALEALRNGLKAQYSYLAAYETPSEPIAYETLRTLDDLFCRDLMEPNRKVSKSERMFRSISTWGVNHALRRIVPATLVAGPFRDFPSIEANRNKANDFIFNCGVLAHSERFEGWMEDGLLAGELRRSPESLGSGDILELRSVAESCYDEQIGVAGLRWAGDQVWHQDRVVEIGLETRHQEIEPELERHVRLDDGWRIAYSSTRQIDDYFFEWAKLYLRRIFSQDLIGLEDVIGGRSFSQYLDVLSALSARSQKHIAFAAILRARNPSNHIRNLLTTYCPRRLFVDSLADFMEGDSGEIESILSSFTLSADNIKAHTGGAETTWAPLVQASKDTLILPTYGIDINPFLFLLTDLRYRYEADWFRVANNREGRWIGELEALFPLPNWQTHGRNLRLRESGKDVTDIDFAVYDSESNDLGLIQLKWQHPVGSDNRARRSTGKNFTDESNKWIAKVTGWLERHGTDELMQRLRFTSPSTPKVRLFVLGRYHAHFGGYDNRDQRAIWSDWAHFRRICVEGASRHSLERLASQLPREIERSCARKVTESLAFPLGNIGVVLNPITSPKQLEPVLKRVS